MNGFAYVMAFVLWLGLTGAFPAYIVPITLGCLVIVLGPSVPGWVQRFLSRTRRKREVRKRALIDFSRVERMEGVEFESYLESLFTIEGFRVKTTKKSGDFGADLLLKKGKQHIAVQAKRYKQTVGVHAIQEVFAGAAFYGAQEKWVVATNGYTKNAKTLADKIGVRLIDRKELMEYAYQSARKVERRSAQKKLPLLRLTKKNH